ncbi:hypothetical protein [Streptomyces xiaopingdaonensis]|uniref:hypothetical protein n=1 Tax=Streptomyces xiaopingdaonensis TaxID=1565415 RepID=UPI0003829C25|nr:hypothetical protein [Streptomyces xiaopingdaonensis]
MRTASNTASPQASWAQEARRCGRTALLLPVLAAVAAFAAFSAGPPEGTLLGRLVLECALPVATALACATVVVREPMAELHMTLPTGYPRTVTRRLTLVGEASAVSALLLVAALLATGSSPAPAATLVELLAHTVLLSGTAVWSAVRFGSGAAATGTVAAVVVAKVLLLDQAVPQATVQAPWALLVGGALFLLALRTLADAERFALRLQEV